MSASLSVCVTSAHGDAKLRGVATSRPAGGETKDTSTTEVQYSTQVADRMLAGVVFSGENIAASAFDWDSLLTWSLAKR